MMKKHPLPAWAGCLLLIGLTVWGTLQFWRPITAESGTRYTLRLERVYEARGAIWLDFGKSDDFRMPPDMDWDDLPETVFPGREYIVIADYHAKRRGSDYYDVYALTSADDTEYLTIEQSEARRQELLPRRLALIIGLDAAACCLLIWAERRRKKAAQPAAVEEAPHEPPDAPA